VPPEPKDPVAYAFVREVMTKLGVENPRQLSRVLGYLTADTETNARRWATGINAPNFHGTIDLLEAASWLKPAGLEAYERAVEQAGLTPQVRESAEAARRRAAELQERRRRTGGSR
jgi:hypothetical protein